MGKCQAGSASESPGNGGREEGETFAIGQRINLDRNERLRSPASPPRTESPGNGRRVGRGAPIGRLL